MLKEAKAIHEQLIAWRREIHMHPELGFEETNTARLVTQSLEEMGIEAQAGVGKTGVVGYLGEGNPIIGIRADMDALPIEEANDVPYKSQTPGLMHSCGHDAHTAMLLGTAKILSEMPNRPPGQIRFFFQPSEEKTDDENKSGATRMIEDGIMQDVDAVIALHVDSESPANKIAVASGHISAAQDAFWATIKGTGGHGAFPHNGTDPVFMLAQVINAINGVRARRINPIRAAVISIGSIHAGVATNVIPSEVKISGTIRSFDEETRDLLHRELESALSVTRALGGDYELEIKRGYIATYNDADVVETIRDAVNEMIRSESLEVAEPMMGAEDFSYMTQAAPGAMFQLGAKYDDRSRAHHTPIFDISEDVLPTGTAVLADTACRLLKQVESG